MWRKVLSYLGMTIAILLLVETMFTTYYLGKIDAGLKTSLSTTASLVQIQTAIIHKNETLQDVVATTKQMDTKLNNTLQATQAIHAHIDKINELNSATLKLNQQMVLLGAQSGQMLGSIAASMGDLKQATDALSQSLTKLRDYVRQDSANMTQMKNDTDQMDRKVPGVLK